MNKPCCQETRPTADAAVRGRLKSYRLEEVHVVGTDRGATDLAVTR